MNRRRNDKSKRFRASDVVARRNAYLLIDGYNLMHVTRFKPLRNDQHELRRCREGLLSLLAEQLPDAQYRAVTIVFDSNQAPQHLPDRLRWRHLDVVFARTENTADDLIAKLVQTHAHPRRLIVVSSDHRVQNAASRRKATVLDSEAWFDALLDHRQANEQHEPATTKQEQHDVAEHEPRLDPDQLSEFIAEMKQPTGELNELGPNNSPQLEPEEEMENPFPPGYFDDLDDLDDQLF